MPATACLARSAGASRAPDALEEHEAAAGRGHLPPGAERADRIRHRPEDVALDHGVEGSVGRCHRRPHLEREIQAPRSGLPARLREHALGQVQSGHAIPELGREQAQRACARPRVEHRDRRLGQGPAQCGSPGGRLQRIGDRVRRGEVIGLGIAIPEVPDAVVHVGQAASPSGVVRRVERRASAGTPPREDRHRVWRTRRPSTLSRWQGRRRMPRAVRRAPHATVPRRLPPWPG